jgi:hypothetical protein
MKDDEVHDGQTSRDLYNVCVKSSETERHWNTVCIILTFIYIK